MTARGIAILALVAAGCAPTATQLLVVVDSDLDVPREMNAVRARLYREGEAAPLAEDRLGVEGFGLPLSYAIVPPGGAPAARIVVEVQGLLGDSVVVTRRAVTAFTEGRLLLLPMFLARTCRASACGAGETCTGRGCASEEVPPSSLGTAVPGQEIDGGPR